jgi:hypothetical protein
MKSKYIFNKTVLKGKRSLEKARLHDLTNNLSPNAFRLLTQPGAESTLELDEFINSADAIDTNIQKLDSTINKPNRKIKIAEEVESRRLRNNPITTIEY